MTGKPSIPPPAPPPAPLPPPPERSDADIAALAEQQRAKFFKRGGRAATLLTGGSGTEGGSGAIRFLGGTART